jgi:hypothetical protein
MCVMPAGAAGHTDAGRGPITHDDLYGTFREQLVAAGLDVRP